MRRGWIPPSTASAVLLMGLLAPLSLAETPQAATALPPMAVAAWVSTAGPYGPMWDLTIAADARATLEVLYPFNPSGRLAGNFEIAEERLATLRRAVETERFFDLPAELGPKEAILAHMPDLRLEIQVGAKKHKVALYDPSQVARLATTRRFLTVWQTVYAGLPIRPTW